MANAAVGGVQPYLNELAQSTRTSGSLQTRLIGLVPDLVLGAAEYARQLGFAPHSDFEQTSSHLGPWTGPSAITFGRNGKPTCNGKPTYISRSYDDPDRVHRTLRNAVGRTGFNYTIGVELSDLPLSG